MEHLIVYKEKSGLSIRQIRFQDDMLEYSFDGWVFKRRYNRRLCDFVQAVRSIKNSGAIIISESGE